MLQLAKDPRPDQAAMLREYADKIEKSEIPPMAIFFQIYWANGEVTRGRNLENGFNLCHSIGILSCIIDDLTDEIRGVK